MIGSFYLVVKDSYAVVLPFFNCIIWCFTEYFQLYCIVCILCNRRYIPHSLERALFCFRHGYGSLYRCMWLLGSYGLIWLLLLTLRGLPFWLVSQNLHLFSLRIAWNSVLLLLSRTKVDMQAKKRWYFWRWKERWEEEIACDLVTTEFEDHEAVFSDGDSYALEELVVEVNDVFVFELFLGEGKTPRGWDKVQGLSFVLDSHENQSMQDSFDGLNKSLCLFVRVCPRVCLCI